MCFSRPGPFVLPYQFLTVYIFLEIERTKLSFAVMLTSTLPGLPPCVARREPLPVPLARIARPRPRCAPATAALRSVAKATVEVHVVNKLRTTP